MREGLGREEGTQGMDHHTHTMHVIGSSLHPLLQVLNVLLVIAYADGTPAHAHFINHTLCQKYWLRWLLRLQEYQTQFSEDLSELIN